MESIFFSVIIPTLNSEAFLKRTIKSVLGQTFRDFEILIMDGLSVDQTLSIVQQEKDARITTYSEKDHGIYDAMNKGTTLAKGKWLYFLGSDDVLYDNNVFLDVFELLSVTDCNVLYGDIKMVNDASWAKDGTIYDGEFDLNKLFRTNIGHQAIFYKREFVLTIGLYNTNYHICADWDFNLRCRAMTDFVYFNRIVAYFYGGGASTKSVDKNLSKDFLTNIIKYYQLNIFDPVLNNKSFPRFKEVLRLQKKTNPLRYYLNRLKMKLNLIV